MTELQSAGHSIRIRMDVLDTDWQTIAAFYDTGLTGDYPENILVDGNIDVDVTRLTRRTFTASVLNDNGIWSPEGAASPKVQTSGHFRSGLLLMLPGQISSPLLTYLVPLLFMSGLAMSLWGFFLRVRA